MTFLGSEERRLLTEIVEKWRPEWLDVVSASKTRTLTLAERQELCDMLANELVATGLGDDDEPNQRGRSIEGLIDRLNPHAG